VTKALQLFLIREKIVGMIPLVGIESLLPVGRAIKARTRSGIVLPVP
jgi:hypothetical protein